MARITISTSELLEAVKTATGANANPDDAYTVAEISEAMGAGVHVTRERLNRLKRAGLLEVLSARREALDGRLGMVPAYRFLKGKKRA
jgi:hypothetical protein